MQSVIVFVLAAKLSNVCVLLCYVTVLVSMCVCHVYLINYLLTYYNH